MPWHAPAWHESPVLQLEPSSHGVPFATALWAQPAGLEQVSAVQGVPSLQLAGAPPQTPAWHVSPVVQTFPSEHGVPAGAWTEVHPLALSQPSTVHGLPSSYAMGTPLHAPSWHVSLPVHGLPSLLTLVLGASTQPRARRGGGGRETCRCQGFMRPDPDSPPGVQPGAPPGAAGSLARKGASRGRGACGMMRRPPRSEEPMQILMPLPSRDFDPTESAVPWRVLTEAGHEVVFATPDGRPAEADPITLTGRGLGPWRPILRARADAREHYAAMTASPAWARPLRYEALEAVTADGLALPGGHAPGMKPYLESAALQRFVARHVAAGRPAGAICHGVVVLARCTHPATGAPLLAGRRVTALTRSQELSGWLMTALWLGRTFRTYPQTVQAEVVQALGDPARFEEGPFAVGKDGPERASGFVVRDGALVTARWPGDAWTFAAALRDLLA